MIENVVNTYHDVKKTIVITFSAIKFVHWFELDLLYCFGNNYLQKIENVKQSLMGNRIEYDQ